MAKKTEEIAVREKNEITPAIPDWMLEDELAMSNAGLEEIKKGDMTLPRLAIAQATHDEVKDGHEKYIEGLRPGMLFNTLTKDIYGKGPILVTPLFMNKNRRLFTDRKEGSQTLCVSNDGILPGVVGKQYKAASCIACPKSQFRNDPATGKPLKPECTLFYTYVIIIHLPNRRFMPIAFSLKGKMTKVASDWNSLMQLRGHAAFAGVYNMSTYLDSAPAGDFYNVRISNAGVIDNKQAYDDAKALFKSLYEKRSEIAYDETGLHQPDDGEVIDGEEVPF